MNLRAVMLQKFFFQFLLVLSLFLLCISVSNAQNNQNLFPKKRIYFGINVGGGSTEWKYLVDTTDPNDPSYTTPAAVSEGGASWGLVLGYDVSKNFAIEAQYMQFANADITLAPINSPYVDQNGNPIPSIVSQTEAFSLSGKFLAQIAKTHLRAFAAIGAGMVERTDPLVNYQVGANPPPYSNYTGKNSSISCVTPYLSTGLVYSLSRHWMVESGFQYYTGFGKSQLDPMSSFIPFAWDAYGRLAYQL